MDHSGKEEHCGSKISMGDSQWPSGEKVGVGLRNHGDIPEY